MNRLAALLVLLALVGFISAQVASSSTNQTEIDDDDIELTGLWTNEEGNLYFAVRHVENLIWWYAIRAPQAPLSNDTAANSTTAVDANATMPSENATSTSMKYEHLFSGVVSFFKTRQQPLEANATAPVGIIAGTWASIPLSEQEATVLKDAEDEEWGALSLYILSNDSIEVFQESNGFMSTKLMRYKTPQECICTAEYAPVCGQLADGSKQTFGNRCQMNCSKATFLSEGECL